MLKLISKKVLHIFFILLGVSFLSFLIINAAPGDFLSTLSLNPQISPEIINTIKKDFGLDKSFFVQYFIWLKNMFLLDFGYSFSYRVPVIFLVKTRLVNTLLLNMFAFFLAWVLIIPLGLLCAYKKNSFIDRIITLMSASFIAVPSFFFALILIYFASKTNLFPIGGEYSLNVSEMSLAGRIIDFLHHAFLPASVLAVLTAGPLIKILRSSAIEVMNSEYITVLRARGISEFRIFFVHVLRGSINPLITILGYQLSALLSGAAFVEIVFSWPGIGRLMLDAVMSQDLYLIMGNLVISAFLLICGNLLADVFLRISDPRVRWGSNQ